MPRNARSPELFGEAGELRYNERQLESPHPAHRQAEHGGRYSDPMAFFDGLVETEAGELVGVAYVGETSYYVIDDHGFRRHVEAAQVDRVVLAQFVEQLQENQDAAAEAMLRIMGKDDLFSKAMVDSTIRNASVDQALDQHLPMAARQWLGMLGFRVVINLHGEVVRVDMPAAEVDDDR